MFVCFCILLDCQEKIVDFESPCLDYTLSVSLVDRQLILARGISPLVSAWHWFYRVLSPVSFLSFFFSFDFFFRSMYLQFNVYVIASHGVNVRIHLISSFVAFELTECGARSWFIHINFFACGIRVSSYETRCSAQTRVWNDPKGMREWEKGFSKQFQWSSINLWGLWRENDSWTWDDCYEAYGRVIAGLAQSRLQLLCSLFFFLFPPFKKNMLSRLFLFFVFSFFLLLFSFSRISFFLVLLLLLLFQYGGFVLLLTMKFRDGPCSWPSSSSSLVSPALDCDDSAPKWPDSVDSCIQVDYVCDGELSKNIMAVTYHPVHFLFPNNGNHRR